MRDRVVPLFLPHDPDRKVLLKYIESALDSKWLTNFGPLHEQLSIRLAELLGLHQVLLVSSGTAALDVTRHILGVKNKVYTSPFTFYATATSFMKSDTSVEFVDIDPSHWNTSYKSLLELSKIDCARGSAIVSTLVYGNPGGVEEIGKIAKSLGIPLILDACHAVGITGLGELLKSVDGISAAAFSLHATKILSGIEGGVVYFRDASQFAAAREYINFGLDRDRNITCVGTNYKMSELHCAYALASLDEFEETLRIRRELKRTYSELLNGYVQLQSWDSGFEDNGAYMPLVLQDHIDVDSLINKLSRVGVGARRYFYPALHKVPIYRSQALAPVAERISEHVLCLPLHTQMNTEDAAYCAEALKCQAKL